MKKMNKGFTLIELMLAVMIIAIIAAIALPSYQAYVRKSLESNVQQEIQKIMRDLEHQKSRQFNYLGYVLSPDPLYLPSGATATTAKYKIEVMDGDSSAASQIKSNYVASNYAKTKYPLVFAHGMGGWIRAGTDELGVDYWYQILPDLARNGANAWATRVSPFNTSEVRGEQLLQQVDEILAITGAPKVNLLGHSHGGHSIVYVSNVMPNKIASATAISSPLKGSPVADLIISAQGTPLEQPLVGLINFGSKAIVWAQQQNPNLFPHDALGAGKSLSQAGSKAFAQKYPLGMPKTSCGEGLAKENGVYFYSFSGNSTLTNVLDPDSLLGATGLLMQAPNDNDGLVSRCSAKYGKTVRDNYNWNHLDVINQFFGLRSIFAPDPVDVYRQHANRLKLQGL